MPQKVELIKIVEGESSKLLFLILFFLFIFFQSFGYCVTLITPEEAAQPDSPFPKKIDLIQKDGNGPEIKITSPPLDKPIHGPFIIDISFEALSGKIIDYGSFKVKYLKSLPIDLTGRIKRYLNENRLFIKDVKIPRGTHRLQFSIAYISGEKTTMDLILTVD